MRVLFPQTPTEQTAYPAVINRSHPLGAAITACLDATVGGPNRPSELVTGLPGTLVTVTQTIQQKYGVYGLGYHPTHGFNDGTYWPASSAFGDATAGTDFSIESLITATSDLTNTFARFLDFGAGAAGGLSGGWDLEVDSGGNLNFVVWNGGSPGSFAATAGMVAGRGYHLVQTLHWTSGTTWNLKLYVNGALLTATTCNASKTNQTKFLYANYQTGGGLASPNILMHYARIYQGVALSADDVLSLYTNPWQVYEPIMGLGVDGGAPAPPPPPPPTSSPMPPGAQLMAN